MNSKRILVGRIGAVSLVAAAIVLTAGPGQAQATLTMNGKVVSQGVRSVGGSPMVRLSDVAKALGMIVVKRPGGYEITKAGGANQVGGKLQGAIGDVLFDGYWRFQVQSVETPQTYAAKTPGLDLRGEDTSRYDEDARLLHAVPGYQLVVVHCRMTNAQKDPHTFWYGSTSDVKNALTDTQGESYPPLIYDMESNTSSKRLLPGAGTALPIIFCVPEGTQIKDLVFTLRNNDSDGEIHDVRVSLTKGK